MRRRIEIRGVVQGVFFRDTVRRIAFSYDISGFVRNVGFDLLEIEAEGEPHVVEAFIADVLAHPPAAARVDDVQSTLVDVRNDEGFTIRH